MVADPLFPDDRRGSLNQFLGRVVYTLRDDLRGDAELLTRFAAEGYDISLFRRVSQARDQVGQPGYQ